MRKRSLRMITVCTACALLLGGCGSVTGLLNKDEETESIPEESSVAEVVISPEEQARLDLLDSLEDVTIPTTTQTNRKDLSGTSGVSDEYSLSVEYEEESEEENDDDLPIGSAWLSDDETRQEFVSDDGYLQLAVPLDWQDLTGELTTDDEVNQSFTVQIGNFEQATFFMSNSESRRYSPFMSLDEYSSAIVAAVYNSMTDSEDFSDAELLETVDLDSRAQDFVIRKSTLAANYKGNPVVYYIYAVQGSYRYIQFNCWTAAGQKETAEPVFDEIVTGFYELY